MKVRVNRMNLSKKAILIVDDDIALGQMIQLLLEAHGAVVHLAHDGHAGVEAFYIHQPDLVILDVIMPGLSGWQICQQIRSRATTPILMLTSLKDDEDVVRGLEMGADDYLEKPFSDRVLLARIQALLRRATLSGEQKTAVYNDGHLKIDFEKQRVFVKETAVKLSATEMKLLTYVYKHAGHVLPYTKILSNVWGEEYEGNHDYVHVYVSRLRQKLEDEKEDIVYFYTEHGIGYRFELR